MNNVKLVQIAVVLEVIAECQEKIEPYCDDEVVWSPESRMGAQSAIDYILNRIIKIPAFTPKEVYMTYAEYKGAIDLLDGNR